MRVKHEYSRQGLLAVGRIVATVLEELIREVKPGLATARLDERAKELLDKFGAAAVAAAEFGFPANLSVCVNDEVAHGLPGDRELREGDLVKLDLTARKNGFVADAARMAVVPPASAETMALAESCRLACHIAIAGARVGVGLSALGALVDREAVARGFRVVRELRGHGVGRRVHEQPEVPNFEDSGNADVLGKGTVIAIEPIFTPGSGEIRDKGDGWTLVTADGAWAGHYEETVIIGEDGAEVATVC